VSSGGLSLAGRQLLSHPLLTLFGFVHPAKPVLVVSEQSDAFGMFALLHSVFSVKVEGLILSHHVEVASRDAVYSFHQCPRGAWPAGIWFSLSHVSPPPLHVRCCPSGWLPPPFEQDSPPSSLLQNENRPASLSRGSRLRYWLSPLSLAPIFGSRLLRIYPAGIRLSFSKPRPSYAAREDRASIVLTILRWE
jgi:hypothetical protein